MKSTINLKPWWNQFPSKLRKITICRLLASTGAGGVLYLTPLVFNNLSFTATQIGIGFCAAAIAGTLTRLITGIYLDKGIGCEVTLRVAAFLAIIADFLLFNADSYKLYLIGELFLGGAAGFYWPSVEIAVPICSKKGSSKKGFALARTSDALGVSIGALIGSLAATVGYIRFIYLFEMICMVSLVCLISKENIISNVVTKSKKIFSHKQKYQIIGKIKNLAKLINLLMPILIISILGTSILSLMQIGVQLDLVKGGIIRQSINSTLTGWIIAYKLLLLLMIQWPIGNWISKKNVTFSLKLSILNFFIGSILLVISSFYKLGLILFLLGLIPISIGIALFLPTATEAIVQVSPTNKLGLSMAIYSQCFGVSFLCVPIIAGNVFDSYGNAIPIWLLTSICCLIVYPSTNKIKP